MKIISTDKAPKPGGHTTVIINLTNGDVVNLIGNVGSISGSEVIFSGGVTDKSAH